MTEPRYITIAKLICKPKGEGRIEIKNLLHQTSLEGPEALQEVIDFFKTPSTFTQFYEVYEGVDPEILAQLCSHFMLLKEQEAELLGLGLLIEASQPIGQKVRLHELPDASHSFALIGAPVDIASGGDGGARHGPSEIRRACTLSLYDTLRLLADLDLRQQYTVEGLTLYDLGDVFFYPGESIERFGQRLTLALEMLLERGLTPVMLGGDHSVSWFALRLLLSRLPKLGIIHFDAHPDLYPAPNDQLTHANPFLFALRQGSLSHLRQIGLRTMEPVLHGQEILRDERVSFISAREVQRLSPEDVFRGLPTDIPYYLSFDVDCMSPSFVKETGTRVPGGLDFYQGLELLDYAVKRFELVGADFVEVGKAQQQDNMAAQVCARYLSLLLLSRCKIEPLEGHFFSW